MSEPRRTWWWLSILSFGIFLLLATSVDATEMNKKESNETHSPMDESNFEVVDIGKHDDNEDLQRQTGQTTRIIVSQEVDDNFWLKHLGEDFKYAIHIPIEDDGYNGMHNMTEDATNYDDKHDYNVKEEDPVHNNQSDGKHEDQNPEKSENPDMDKANERNEEENASAQYNNSTEIVDDENQDFYTLQPDTDTPSMVTQSSSEAKVEDKEIQQHDRTNTSTTQTNNQNSNEQQHKHDQEQIKQKHPSEQHKISQHQQNQQQHAQHQQQHQQEQQHVQLQIQEQIQKTQNTNRQKIQKQNNKKKLQNIRQKENKDDSTRKLWNSHQPAPVVITLPDDNRTIHHSADEEKPIYVNMPPVIYHQAMSNAETPTYKEKSYKRKQHNNQHTLPTHNQYTTNYNQPSQHHGNTIYRQHNPPNDQHSHLHTPVSHTQYYGSPQLNSPTIYRNGAHYPSSYQSHTSHTPNAYYPITNQQQTQRPKSIDPVRLILRKTAKPYNEHMHHNQIPLEHVF